MMQVCVPNWPFFNKNPLKFQKAVEPNEVTCVEYTADDTAEIVASNIARLHARRAGKK
jgi:CRISPR/Cas system CMR-associated protein Cmr3 (group 5 of RAMP superfamily)